jgi:nucleoside-diphosphate-sugar epimerase
MHLEADVSRLKSLIGWTPSADLDAGIQKLIEDEGFNR